MNHGQIAATIDDYLDKNWETMVADIGTLVAIPSVEETDKAAEGAPYGPGPAQALEAGLRIAADMGFDTHNMEGYVGYADMPGESDTQIAIIGHMDVVPEGTGWTFPPFSMTRKDGFLIGRGTLDDKGPSVVALHAMKFWKDQGVKFPYTLRFIFGANEETDLRDVEYYRERVADPAFLFTPDAEFPVSYGEKGGFNGLITSKKFDDGVIIDFKGGVATNAVPSDAYAVIRADVASLPKADRVTVTDLGEGVVRLDAAGKSAHASTPEQGINAIGILVDYILENDLVSGDEKSFLELDKKLLDHTDGSGIGIATSDKDFGPLTVIGGTVEFKDGQILQSFDSRFPTTIDKEGILSAVSALANPIGATVENTLYLPPFLVPADSPVIQALLTSYNEVTGEHAKPFTMGGGTYAREFTSGASFGPEKSWETYPDWVGSMHGPDEGVSEDLLKEAFRIYATTLDRLMKLDL